MSRSILPPATATPGSSRGGREGLRCRDGAAPTAPNVVRGPAAARGSPVPPSCCPRATPSLPAGPRWPRISARAARGASSRPTAGRLPTARRPPASPGRFRGGPHQCDRGHSGDHDRVDRRRHGRVRRRGRRRAGRPGPHRHPLVRADQAVRVGRHRPARRHRQPGRPAGPDQGRRLLDAAPPGRAGHPRRRRLAPAGVGRGPRRVAAGGDGPPGRQRPEPTPRRP
jgi:hypothetical protein